MGRFYYLQSNAEATAMIEKGYRMERPDGCPEQISDVMGNCWSIDPEQRPTFKLICGVLDEVLSVGKYVTEHVIYLRRTKTILLLS